MSTIPHIIKYMGSKRNIIDFVKDSIEEILIPNQRIYDLFGGSAVVSGSFREVTSVTCNDIQSYTKVLADTYLQNYNWGIYPDNILDKILDEVNQFILNFDSKNKINLKYNDTMSFDQIKAIQDLEQNLQFKDFNKSFDHLFSKYYSGTFWSFEQCKTIDAVSSVARNNYRDTFLYNIILSSLMFAMSYTSQSTGHYAQFRDLTEDNQKDILMYRNKSLIDLFTQKFLSLKEVFNGDNNTNFEHNSTVSSYEKALDNIENNSLVYADPPYQFVHYSRFYHALETLVKYDYPEIKYKGRYRTDRHQSPFCIKTKVENAFTTMFQKTFDKSSSLVLSYSNTGMITLEELVKLGETIFKDYNIIVKEIEYKHSTMGRQKDKFRDVLEAIIIFQAR